MRILASAVVVVLLACGCSKRDTSVQKTSRGRLVEFEAPPGIRCFTWTVTWGGHGISCVPVCDATLAK